MDKVLIGQENAEFVAQAEKRCTFGKRSAGDASGFSWDLWNRGGTQHF